ncbi:MAG: asparagine synthase-related protein [Bacteroidota bacterium]|nr:asparagine synthase-related protein [Bacteroidota bacterium]
MQSFFGKINLIGDKVLNTNISAALHGLAFEKKRKRSIHCHDNYGFGAIEFFAKRHTRNEHSIFQKNSLLIIGDCRIDNRETLIEQLKINDPNIPDLQLILQCYQQWKTDCPEYLTGDFAFAIWDSEKEELFCARDHFGVKPFNYYLDEQQIIFSSEIRGILSQKNIKLTIDQQFIADTISIIKSEHYRSTFNEIKKLPPAHYLYLKNGQLTVTRYWNLKPSKIKFETEHEFLTQFKNLLFQAVFRRVQDPVNYGTELSGGIDSSSITSIAAQNVSIKTFSHVMPDNKIGKVNPFKDEKKYINLLTDFCNLKDRFYITSEKKGITDALKNSLSLNRCIVQQNFSVFSDQLYQAAEEQNIQVLLSGFGGDEVVTSKSGNYLKEIINKKTFTKDLKKQGYSTFSIFFTQLKIRLKNTFPQLTGIFIRLLKGKKWWAAKYENLAVNPSFNRNLHIKTRYLHYYKAIRKDNLIDQSIERITHPHVAQRLEYCSLAAKQYGIEYRYPLLDKDLIEFYLSMPPHLKAQKGILRYAIRQVMEGYLPDEIRWRNDKSGATIPTVYLRTLKDKDKIIEIIEQAKSNPNITQYIDMQKYEKWCSVFFQRSQNDKFINPGAFYNYLKLILFINDNPSLFE